MRASFFALSPIVIGSLIATMYGCSSAERIYRGRGPKHPDKTEFSAGGTVEQTDAESDDLTACAATTVKAEVAKVDIIFIVDALMMPRRA